MPVSDQLRFREGESSVSRSKMNECPKDPSGHLWVSSSRGYICANCGIQMKVIK